MLETLPLGGVSTRRAEGSVVSMSIAAVIRPLVGLLYIAAGAAEMIRHAAFAQRFAHWGIPGPSIAVWAVGATEVVCGLLFALGALTRPVGLLLATIAIGAIVTMGRIDGGLHLAVPVVLFLATVFFAWRSGRFGGPAPARRPGVQ